MYSQEDVLKMYRAAIARGDRNMATNLLLAMAEACPFCRPGVCGEIQFCPDCSFYGGKMDIPNQERRTN